MKKLSNVLVYNNLHCIEIRFHNNNSIAASGLAPRSYTEVYTIIPMRVEV